MPFAPVAGARARGLAPPEGPGRCGVEYVKRWPLVLHARRFFSDSGGQAVAEYGILVWFMTLIGAVSLVMFIFAFEASVVGYYEDIVNVICLPVP